MKPNRYRNHCARAAHEPLRITATLQSPFVGPEPWLHLDALGASCAVSLIHHRLPEGRPPVAIPLPRGRRWPGLVRVRPLAGRGHILAAAARPGRGSGLGRVRAPRLSERGSRDARHAAGGLGTALAPAGPSARAGPKGTGGFRAGGSSPTPPPPSAGGRGKGATGARSQIRPAAPRGSGRPTGTGPGGCTLRAVREPAAA